MIFTVLFLLLCIPNTIANGENNQLKTIRKEQWMLIIQDSDGFLGYYDIPSGYYQEPIYNSIFDNKDYDAPILVEKDSLWGYIKRESGETVIPFQFTACTEYSDFINGYALAANRINTNDGSLRYEYILIDKSGNRVHIPERYLPISPVCGTQKSVVVIGENGNGEYAYGIYQIDKGIVIEPQYDEIWFGNCNYFCFRDSSQKIGVVYADGSIVVPPQYYTNGSSISYLSHEANLTSLLIDGYYTVYNDDRDAVYIFVNNITDEISIFDLSTL